MTKMNSSQMRNWAMSMYLNEQRTQQEIADACGVSRQTIIRWAKKDKWEEHKASMMMTRAEIIKSWQNQLIDINRVISEREEGKRHATPTEVNTITQLAASINKLETELGVHEKISVAQDFIRHLRELGDHELTKKFVGLFDAYIKSQL